jgi:hypothetical protein
VLVNALFFFLLPVVWCVRCCAGDETNKMNSESSFIGKSLVRKEVYSDDDDDGDEESWRLLRPNAASSDYSDHYHRSSETIFKVTNLRNPFDERVPIDDEDETVIKDTEFVVSAINDSHESLRKLVSK